MWSWTKQDDNCTESAMFDRTNLHKCFSPVVSLGYVGSPESRIIERFWTIFWAILGSRRTNRRKNAACKLIRIPLYHSLCDLCWSSICFYHQKTTILQRPPPAPRNTSTAPFTVVPTKFRTSAWMVGWLVGHDFTGFPLNQPPHPPQKKGGYSNLPGTKPW